YHNQLAYVDEELKKTTFLKTLDDYSHSDEHALQLQKYYPDFFKSNYFVMALLQVREKAVLKGYSLPIEAISEKLQKSLEKEQVEAQVFHYLHDQFLVIVSL